jgi:hypothetical protein
MDATAFVQEGKQAQDAQELMPMMQELQQQYPLLGKHQFHVRKGEGPYYSEFYSPWDPENPAKGIAAIEIQGKGQKLKPDAMKRLLLGETFHHLGSVDPTTNQAVDPKWMALKQQFLDSLTPQQIQTDITDYSALNRGGITYPSMAEYYTKNRIDAYFRGYLAPVTDEEKTRWGRTYTPQQQQILEQAKTYLGGQ